MEIKNDYPIYRKLSNNRSFYKVVDSKNFEEIQIIGTKRRYQLIEAKQYPELLFIQDLIAFNHLGILESSEKEWLLYI
jgi:hypothetical protein